MDIAIKQVLTVETTVKAPIEKVWEAWTNPTHIMNWCNASPDWHTPKAENDLKVNERFVTRMEAKDGSFGFDFGGVYTIVNEHAQISYTLDDDRKVNIFFATIEGATRVTEDFETESTNAVELQQIGWQMIMDNFKRYTESI